MWIEVLLAKSNSSAGDTFSAESPETTSLLVATLFGTVGFAVTLTQWLTHIRALLLSSSATRLQSVVKSAWNNLRGEPGRSYQDHLFAYTDLGYHVFHILTALRLVGWSLRTGLLILATLTAVVIAIFLGGSNWSTSPPENQLPPGLLRIAKEGKPVCNCHVCAGGSNMNAFSIDVKLFQLCEFWFQSFGQLCNILDDLEQVKS
jgi:hypothetical protein